MRALSTHQDRRYNEQAQEARPCSGLLCRRAASCDFSARWRPLHADILPGLANSQSQRGLTYGEAVLRSPITETGDIQRKPELGGKRDVRANYRPLPHPCLQRTPLHTVPQNDPPDRKASTPPSFGQSGLYARQRSQPAIQQRVLLSAGRLVLPSGVPCSSQQILPSLCPPMIFVN